MDKTNYRPVSILTVTSKIYEKILSQQLSAYFENIFDKYLCAFRKGQGCQTYCFVETVGGLEGSLGQ